MATKNKIDREPLIPVDRTMPQTEDAQKFSQDLSELQQLKQAPDAPKIPGYILLKPIGQGAYAQVWEALQVRTRKLVAVKVFIKKSGVHWFFLQREAERLIRLDKHPHIVSLLDADLNGETPHYVMDLAQEGSLEKYIHDAKTPLDVEKAADWMKEIAQALHYVHTKQMVHCDLKPANVLLDDEGHVRVADFGHSRVLSESGGALGTLYYMAPEQAIMPTENEPPQPDVRWDIYALGCTLYVLLSGRVPHEEIGKKLEDTPKLQDRLHIYREAIETSVVPPLFGSTGGRVDRELSAIIAKCMRTIPEERYASIDQILTDLRDRRAGKPVSPLAADRVYRYGKFARRHRVPLLAIGVALLAVLASFFLISRNKSLEAQGTTLNYVLKGREFLAKNDPASAVAYFAVSNKVLPSLLARANAMTRMPPIPFSLFHSNGNGMTPIFSPDGKVFLISGNSGLRFFETATGLAIGRPLKLENELTAAALNQDGSIALLGDAKGMVRLVEVETQKTVGKPMRHEKEITAVAFGPLGKRIVTASADGTARLWNASTGEPLSPPLRHHRSIFKAVFSPDGKRILTVGFDGTARLWDGEKGAPRGEPIRLEMKGALSWYKPDIAFSPDSKTLLTTGWNGTIRFFNDNGGRKDATIFLKGFGAKAVFSPDGGRVLTSVLAQGSLGKAQVFKTRGHQPLKFEMKTAGRFYVLSFSPDGRRILTASSDNIVRLWDAQTGTPLKQLLHGDTVTAADWEASGRFLLTGSKDGFARLWSSAENAGGSVRLDGDPLRKKQPRALFSPDGQKILTYGNTSASLWDASTGKSLGKPLALSGNLKPLFSPDGSHLLTFGTKTRLWDLSDGKSKSLSGTIQGGAFSADGRTLLTGGKDGALRLWESQTAKESGSPVMTGSAVARVFLSGDGKKMASLGNDGSLKLYPVGKKTSSPLAHSRWIRAVTFSPDGAFLLSASGSNAVLWDTVSGKELRTFKHGGSIASVLFSPDNKTFLTTGTNGTTRLWNAVTGEPIGNPLKHEGPTMESVFSPGGEVLLTLYQNGAWQLWDTRGGEPIGEEVPMGTSPWASRFGQDGKTILLLDKQGSLSKFDASWMDPQMDAQELLLASEVAGLCRVNPQGSVEPIPPDEWSKLWRKYRKAAIP